MKMEILPAEIIAEIIKHTDDIELRLVCRQFDDIVCDKLRRRPITLFLCDYNDKITRRQIYVRMKHGSWAWEDEEKLQAKYCMRMFDSDLKLGGEFIRRIKPINWKVHIIRRGDFNICRDFLEKYMPDLVAKFGVDWHDKYGMQWSNDRTIYCDLISVGNRCIQVDHHIVVGSDGGKLYVSRPISGSREISI